MDMGQTITNDQSLEHTRFQPLQSEAFQRLQQAASLKGLLKPFKGKGELDQFAELCRAQESGLKALAQEVLGQARQYPFTLVPVRLIEQNTHCGTLFLRWQRVTDRRMGVGVWAEMLDSPRTPESMFAAGLGQLLLGQPTTQDQHPNDTGRLSDGALVKLFRIVRLARRLIDLEIRSSTDPALQTDR